MSIVWSNDQPIYRQLRERIVSLILSGALKEGECLPSVRQMASDYQINHITVSKAYQELVDMLLVVPRRGMGMYILAGAQQKLHLMEREKFFQQELPALVARLQELEINLDELYLQIKALKEGK